jgi:hypothetical protein
VALPAAPGVEDHSLSRVIKSYLYWQFRDDDNLQALVDSQNEEAQRFIDWFLSLNLPIYTRDPVAGALLDWVAEGLYGLPRPVLSRTDSSAAGANRGPYNTWMYNTLALNSSRGRARNVAERASDDIYRRVLTWHFFKGDGRAFAVRYLKRRIQRFLTCPNGIDLGVDQTYRTSITFGLCCQVNITLRRFMARVRRAAIYNTFQFNTTSYNNLEVEVTVLGDQLDLARQLKEAIDQGFLELPFQYTFLLKVQ